MTARAFGQRRVGVVVGTRLEAGEFGRVHAPMCLVWSQPAKQPKHKHEHRHSGIPERQTKPSHKPQEEPRRNVYYREGWWREVGIGRGRDGDGDGGTEGRGDDVKGDRGDWGRWGRWG